MSFDELKSTGVSTLSQAQRKEFPAKKKGFFKEGWSIHDDT